MYTEKYRLCWYMTEKCHLSCPFCYAFKDGIDPTYQEISKVGSALIDQGVSSINLAGGEPLLNKQTFRVIQDYHQEIKLSITTSAALQNISKLLVNSKYLDRICVSLDSLDEATSIQFRGDNYDISTVVRNIRTISEERENIEINTVLTGFNVPHMDRIGDFLSSLECDVKWKLFQVTWNFNNSGLDRVWSLSPIHFDNAAKHLTKRHKNISIASYNSDHLNDNYVIIRPTGDISIPSLNNYQSLGNIKEISIDDAIRPWSLRRSA